MATAIILLENRMGIHHYATLRSSDVATCTTPKAKVQADTVVNELIKQAQETQGSDKALLREYWTCLKKCTSE